MKENVLLEKSFQPAVDVVLLHKELIAQREYVLSRQVLRSCTSIGANAEEANGSISRADFSAKISISYKEARETLYWLRLLQATGYLDQQRFTKYSAQTEELCRILYSILRKCGRVG